jgi:ABC-type taurine transport system ATPase subunit
MVTTLFPAILTVPLAVTAISALPHPLTVHIRLKILRILPRHILFVLLQQVCKLCSYSLALHVHPVNNGLFLAREIVCLSLEFESVFIAQAPSLDVEEGQLFGELRDLRVLKSKKEQEFGVHSVLL